MGVRLKIAVLISCLVTLAVLGVTFYQLRTVEAAAKSALAASQFAMVSTRAQALDQQLRNRLVAIERVARAIPAEVFADSTLAFEFMSGPLVPIELFNGVFLLDSAGRVMADAPFKPGRVGLNAADRPYFQRARDTRQSVISDPFVGRPYGQPQVAFAVPVYDRQGAFRGVITAVLDVLVDDVLAALAKQKIGKTGYFYLATRHNPVLVSHPIATAVLEPITKPNPYTVKAIGGWEGSAESVNTYGVPAQLSYAQLKTVDWFVASVYPNEEALAPMIKARRDTLWMAGVAALIAGLTAWLVVARMARPLRAMRSEIGKGMADPHYVPDIDTRSTDEFGALARNFIALMKQRSELQAELARAQADLSSRLLANTGELSARTEEMESFLYTLGHDLRAPLRAVQSFAKILGEEDGSRLDAEGLRLIERIVSSGLYMNSLVDGMLELGRVSKYSVAGRIAPIDVDTLVKNELQRYALSPRVRLAVSTLPIALADLRLLRDVWNILIDNAIKFSARKPAPRIEIGGAVKDGEVEYWICDNGAGFDMQYAGSLFRPFSRLHKEDDYGGAGLGLAIARRALEKMGGHISAMSTPGQGATFTFTLPAAPMPADATADAPAMQTPPVAQAETI